MIIPVYKAGECLCRCVESLLSQDFPDFEVILVDDGSPDCSGEICDGYAGKDGRVRVIHKANGGVSEARNAGLELAEGEIVCFVDSDDRVKPGYLETVRLHMRDGIDLLYFQAGHCFPDGSVRTCVPVCGTFTGSGEIEPELARLMVNDTGYEYFGYTWNKAFRLSVLRENGIRFARGLSLKEDEVFTLQYAACAGKIRVIPDVLYEYSVSRSGLTHRMKDAGEWLRLFREEEALIGKFRRKDFRDCLRGRNASFLFSAFKAERGVRASIRRFGEAFRYYGENKAGITKCRGCHRILDKPYSVSLLLSFAYKAALKYGGDKR